MCALVCMFLHMHVRGRKRMHVCASSGNAGVVVADSGCGDSALGPLDERDFHGKASAQTHTKHETPVASCLKTVSGFAKKLRPVFGLCFAAAITSSSINRYQKTDAVFRSSSTFFAFVCSLARRRRGGCEKAVRRL